MKHSLFEHSLFIFLLVVAGRWNAVLPATPPTSSVYPLRPSANGRYIVDASNAPFLIIRRRAALDSGEAEQLRRGYVSYG